MTSTTSDAYILHILGKSLPILCCLLPILAVVGAPPLCLSIFLFSFVISMSLRGVRQLKELVIRYSDYDGSSKGVREWMRTNLVNFAQTNPELAVTTELKRCVHPFVRGNYVNGNTKTICIKNLDPEEITSYVNDLRNQIGRKVSLPSSLSTVLSQLKALSPPFFVLTPTMILFT